MGVKIIVAVSLLVLLISYILYEATVFDSDDLIGKNVLVTGASSGIGQGIAIQYAEFGANVFITARRENELKETIKQMREVGRKDATFAYTVADMSNYEKESPRVIKEAVTSLGGLDHIMLNHALLKIPEFMTPWNGSVVMLDNMKKMFDINLHSYVHLTAHALPYLRASTSGRIGIVGSIAGKTTYRAMITYCSVKYALDGFFGSLRELFEFEGTGITVTYNALGPIHTVGDSRMNPLPLMRVDRLLTLTPRGLVKPTAYEVVRATSLGRAELYYPHLLGFIPGGYRLFPIVKHIKHDLLYAS